MRVRYLREADAEFEEALNWYFERSPNAASRLEEEISVAEKLLIRHPKIGTPSRGRVRFMPIHDFPYSLVYAERTEELVVVAVAHHSRRPGYWKDRLGGEIR